MRPLSIDARLPSDAEEPSTTRPMPFLSLAPHVRACRTGGRIVLLDLRTCRYIGISGGDAPALAHAIQGWPEEVPCDPPTRNAVDAAAVEAITRPLLAKGLLTNFNWLDMRVPQIEPVTASLNADGSADDAPIRAARILRFLRAALLASLRLRYQSLMAIFTRLQTADERLRRRSQPSSTRSLEDAVNAFHRLRPLVFTSKDRCLHDSLILKLFLASEGIPSTWVVGVRTGPFAAHSWVQSGHFVLNDQREHVCGFQPILIV